MLVVAVNPGDSRGWSRIQSGFNAARLSHEDSL